MSPLYLLTPLAITLLVSFPTRAQEAATFHCTFKAVFETIEGDSPFTSVLKYAESLLPDGLCTLYRDARKYAPRHCRRGPS